MSIRPVEKIDGKVLIQHVLISVLDKSNLSILVNGLIENCPRVIIYSSGGTYKTIADMLGPDLAKFHLIEVSEYTGMPETEGGLVKTLHHKLFLGYLTETYSESHQKDMKREEALPIDLVVMNLYPFTKTVKKPSATIEDARGNIDVGGPSALRAAAKNWLRVMSLTNPGSYAGFVNQLRMNDGCTTVEMRYKSLQDTFSYISKYDAAIAKYFKSISVEDLNLDCYQIM